MTLLVLIRDDLKNIKSYLLVLKGTGSFMLEDIMGDVPCCSGVGNEAQAGDKGVRTPHSIGSCSPSRPGSPQGRPRRPSWPSHHGSAHPSLPSSSTVFQDRGGEFSVPEGGYPSCLTPKPREGTIPRELIIEIGASTKLFAELGSWGPMLSVCHPTILGPD